MKILPQSINQSPQLSSRKNNVNFGMYISVDEGSSIISKLSEGIPPLQRELRDREGWNNFLAATRRLVAAFEEHKTQNPASKWIYDRVSRVNFDNPNLLKPEITNATKGELEALSFSVDPLKESEDILPALAEKMENFNGKATDEGPKITVDNYQSEYVDLIPRIARLMRRT